MSYFVYKNGKRLGASHANFELACIAWSEDRTATVVRENVEGILVDAFPVKECERAISRWLAVHSRCP